MDLLIKSHHSMTSGKRTYGLTVDEFLENQRLAREQALASAYIGGIKVRRMTDAEAVQRCHGPLGHEFGNARTLTGDLHRDAQSTIGD